MLAAWRRPDARLRRMHEMRSAAAEVPRSGPSPVRTIRLAGYGGSIAGLAAAWVLGNAIPVRPPSNALPGYAAQQGIDIRRQVAIFFLLVALPILGGAAAAWWARHRRRAVPALPEAANTAAAPRRWEQSLGSRLAVVSAHA